MQHKMCFTRACQGIELQLKAMQDNVERATEADSRLMRNVAVTHRIGFADVILPGLFFSLCISRFIAFINYYAVILFVVHGLLPQKQKWRSKKIQNICQWFARQESNRITGVPFLDFNGQ